MKVMNYVSRWPIRDIRKARAPVLFAIVLLLLSLSACAFGPTVDRSKSDFDQIKFDSDLYNCRDGNFFEATASGVKDTLIGAVAGVFLAFPYIGVGSYSGEIAVVTAAIGAIVGMGTGAYDTRIDQADELVSCLEGKGYTVERYF